MKTAYPSIMGTCSITLYSNIPFDNTYAHHSLISRAFTYNGSPIYNASDATYGLPCERFINRRNPNDSDEYYYPRWTLTGDYNFNFSNGLIASVTLELTPAQTNANYLKLVTGSDVYYYFITGINQNNFDTYTLSLELDVLMTYQDEFLDGVNDMPIFTTRKHSHRYTDDGIMPHSHDFLLNEDMFAGVKPSIIKNKIELEHNNANVQSVKDIKWLYICADEGGGSTSAESLLFHAQGVRYPLSMLVLPLNVNKFVITDGNTTLEYDVDDIYQCIKHLVGSGAMHGAKISNYPPFNRGNVNYNDSGQVLTLTIDGFTPISSTEPYNKFYEFMFGDNTFIVVDPAVSGSGDLINACKHGSLIIRYYDEVDYPYAPINVGTFNNANAPTITDARLDDPKLLFKPFKKYVLTAQYSSDGSEIYPELLYGDAMTNNSTNYFTFVTYTSAFISDNNYYTYLKPYLNTYASPRYYVFDNYKYQKIGLCSNTNYMMPVGTNALEVFNATQAQSFYTSKVASGVSSGIAIAGGVASIIVGSGMTVASSGALSPAGVGMIASGASAIAGGTAGIATTIKSSQAKIEDLKNTPDSINISGSNYISDTAIIGESNPLPYIVVYDVNEVVKEQANDFFYNYGYNVCRECYFNKEVKYTDDHRKVDNNIFGRTIFNYVQLNDDITNKIDANIPHIIKQKISIILNKGITFWSFFGFQQFWSTRKTPSSASYRANNYFLKHTYDNTEYKGNTY